MDQFAQRGQIPAEPDRPGDAQAATDGYGQRVANTWREKEAPGWSGVLRLRADVQQAG